MLKLTKSGKYVMFSPKNVMIYEKLKVIDSPISEEQHMDFFYMMSVIMAYIYKTWENEMVDLWHSCLRQVGYNKLKVIMKKQMLNYLP